MPGLFLATPAKPYAVPGVEDSAPVRRRNFTIFAGTPKFLQAGFLQKLTLMPMTVGGSAGWDGVVAEAVEEFTTNEESPISH